MTRPDTATKHSGEISSMFDAVSKRYDLTNDVLTFGVHRLWRIATVRAVNPSPGDRILDLAAGTGTSSAALAATGATVTAADFSEGMLEVGRQRHRGNSRIEFVWADATKLPFPDATFDAATISFGLRNVNDVPRALAEMRRVVKPGGRVVVTEFSKPVSALRAPYDFYITRVLPFVAGIVGGNRDAYEYLNESIIEWPGQQELAQLLREAGLQRVSYRNLSAGIAAIHRGYVAAEAEAQDVTAAAGEAEGAE